MRTGQSGPNGSWWQQAAVAAASVCLSVLVAELALDVAGYPPPYGEHQQLFVEYDSIRGWRNRAGGHGRFVTPHFTVELDYNERSYRGPLHPYDKQPGTFRVLLLGDSYLEGYTVELDERVAEVAERILNADTALRRVEVIALGTGGYSTDQELLWLESEGVRYEPDVVVLLFVTNDIWFNAQPAYPRGPKPLFVVDGDSLVLTNVPVPRLEPDTTIRRGRSLEDLLRERSRIVRLVDRAIDRSPLLQRIGTQLGLLDFSAHASDGPGQRLAEFSVFATEPSPRAATALDVTGRLLAAMGRTSGEAGAVFRVVLVPPNDAVYPPGARQSARFRRTSPVGDEDRPAERFREICLAARVPCLDPTATFVAAAESLAIDGRLLIVPDDGHWNAEGHRVAAGIVADVVRGVVDSIAAR